MDTKEKPRLAVPKLPSEGRFDTASVGAPAPAETSQDARTGLRGSWPFGLDLIQQTLTVYPDQDRETLISAFRWCVDSEHPMHLKDFAARVKASDNTLYKIFTGKYRYQNEIIDRDSNNREVGRRAHPKAGQVCPLPPGLITNIENFLRLEQKRVALGSTTLVRTPMVKQIAEFCDLIREIQQMGWIIGPSHIGKTWALQYDYTPNNNHGRTIYVRLPAGAGRREVFGCLWQAMSGSSAHGTIDEIKFKIKAALTKDMLIILDEVHLLYHHAKFFKILDEIRELHDVKKAGFVLVFTRLDEVEAAKSKELQQLWRRSPHKLALPKMAAKEDLGAIFDHSGFDLAFEDVGGKPVKCLPAKDLKITLPGLAPESPREIIRQLAKDDGLLAITERIRMAKAIAKKSRKPVGWAHFVQANMEIKAAALQEEEWI